MSDEEFFREIREDIVDTTRKMLEQVGISEPNSESTVDVEKSEPLPTVQKETATKQKATMEFVTLTVEPSNAAVPENEPVSLKTTSDENGTKDAQPPSSKASENKGGKEAASLKKKSEKKDFKQKETKPKKDKQKETIPQGTKSNENKVPNDKANTTDHEALNEKIQKIMARIDDLKNNFLENQSNVPPHNANNFIKASKKAKEKATTSEQNANGHHSGSETDKKGLEKRRKNPEVTSADVQKVASTPTQAILELPSDQKLLLQLCMLSSSQRTKFIEKKGLELGLLDPHPVKKNIVLINQRVLKISESIFAEAKQYLDDADEPSSDTAKNQKTKNKETKQSKIKESPKAKTSETKNPENGKKFKIENKDCFEEHVTFMLNYKFDDQRSKDDYDKELRLKGIRGTSNEILQEKLESFVARLVAKNVGYIVEGTLRINAKNNLQSFVDDPSRIGNIFITSIILRRCAMDGDLVRVFVMNPLSEPDCNEEAMERAKNESSEESTELQRVRSQNNVGFVVAILEKRHNRQCVGKFHSGKSVKKHYRMFVPRDTRIPSLCIFKQDWPNALLVQKDTVETEFDGSGDANHTSKSNVPDVTNVLYQAKIVDWKEDTPVGTILKPLGNCGLLEVENESILVEYNLDITPYEEEILTELPSVPYNIPEDELAKREDLRQECIFTIDPATARDLDDALSCSRLPNGNYHIGVHISDVSYFLREGSPLDEQVKLRATSIYMVDSVYHMLPKQLCNTCSLLPGEDKVAFSVFWEIQPDGTVLSTRFARTVINSCAQLSYEHAQMMLDNPDGELDEERFPEIFHGYSVQGLSKIVNTLQSIAVKLRARRMDDGCLKINQPKLTFRLNPATGQPIEYGVYKVRTSNEMIEDFMLLANTSVAHAIHAAFPAISILRCHSPPAENMMKNLVRTLSNYGHALSYASSKDIRECMESIIASTENPDATRSVLNVLLAKPMIRAQYYCSGFASTPEHFRHYALAIPMYTHFTSPIRRYADCMVHRVLAATLKIDVQPKRAPEELQNLAMICNEKKYNAKLAGEASSILYFRHWLASVGEHQTVGAVMGYAAHYVELVLIHSGLVLKASIRKLASTAAIVFKPVEPVGSCMLIPKDTSIPPIKLELFTKVRVTIKVVHDAITVCSILPIVEELSPTLVDNHEVISSKDKEESNLSEGMMKSARIY
ncbi:DIS3-like exonuclease 2 [Anopheles nili]|uniref:DIS3-like exonuclease 2 n=1 Tax=Anopheles nili TaxID=185578 RepID=UPI00237B13AE|nr:DIS3-like exonuclease 2 [Anopheles nili]